MESRLYVVHALTPLHSGAGEGSGFIDQPISREVATSLPVLHGSSVKGVLRDVSRRVHDGGREEPAGKTWKAFGPGKDAAHEHGSALVLSDARLLLHPVRSDHGTFAWVTCRFVLQRLLRDAAGAGVALPASPPPALASGRCAVAPGSALLRPGRSVAPPPTAANGDGAPGDSTDGGTATGGGPPAAPAKVRQRGQPPPISKLPPNVPRPQAMGGAAAPRPDVVLAGLGFTAEGVDDAWATALAGLVFPGVALVDQEWRSLLAERLCVVPDDTFTWFAENATEVRARIRLDPERGTVATGGLWYEESLPAESVLSGVVQARANGRLRPRQAWGHLETLLGQDIQFGGGASTGQGMARFHVHPLPPPASDEGGEA